MTLFIAAGDRPLKAVRHVDKWEALVRACPMHAHWLDGEPMGGIEAMGGVIDRYRRLLVNGRPIATGVLPLADAWACTNPSLGRGIALGLCARGPAARRGARAPRGPGRAGGGVGRRSTERELTPWYRATVATDRARLAEIDALRHGLDAAGARGPGEDGRGR